MKVTVNCAGPHVDPVKLYEATYPAGVTQPADHAALCGPCGDVYREAVTAPELVPQLDAAGAPVLDQATGRPVMVANPDRIPAGMIPHALIVTRRNKAKDPTWTPPPHNYRAP